MELVAIEMELSSFKVAPRNVGDFVLANLRNQGSKFESLQGLP